MAETAATRLAAANGSRVGAGQEHEPLRLLIVEDNPGDVGLVLEALGERSHARFATSVAESLSEARRHLDEGPVDAVLLDLNLPDSRGLETLDAILRTSSTVAVVILTGLDDEELALEAVRRGAQDYLLKGELAFTETALLRTLVYAIERTHLQREVARGHADYAALIEQNTDGILAVDTSGVVRYANAAAGKLLGSAPRGLVGRDFAFPFAGNGSAEIVVQGHDGEVRVAEMRATETLWEAEQARLVVLHDITERKANEERIRSLNRLLRTTSEINQMIVRERDRQRVVEEACRIAVEHGEFVAACAARLDEADGSPRTSACAGAAAGCLGCLNRTPLTEGGDGYCGPLAVAALEGTVVRIDSISDDTRFPAWRVGALDRGFHGAAALPVLEGSVVVGAFVVYSDQAHVFTNEVMELLCEVALDVGFALENIAGKEARREAEARLAASERRYRLLFERNLAGVYRTTLDGEMLECNDAFAAMFGFDSRDELLAVHANETYGDPADREALLSALHEHGELRSFEHVGRRKDGAPVTMLENASLVEGEDGETIIEGSTIDITEHTRAQEQLQQAQKLEAVGQLAGGVAHDFNNLLQAAIGTAQRVKVRADDPAAVREAVHQMTGVLERGAALTRQLLLFARKQTAHRQPCELNRVIHDAATMLSRLLRETIDLRLDLTEQPLWLHADRGQLGQIIVNLAVNAADAMPRGGVLVVRTRPSDSQHVRLEVEDTGSGMAADVQDRLFEPFFTTKDRGKGTGLGLAVVHGIVTSHDGRISVDSSEGHGTRFTIELPGLTPSDDPHSNEPDDEPSGDEQVLPEGNGQRLLVVDDDEGVLEAVAEMLDGLGYHVATATNAADAHELAEQRRFDLLLCDVVLPKVSGLELAQQLRRCVPGLRVVLMSGYSEDQAVDTEIETGHARFLAKPFSGERLAEMVHEALALDPGDLDQ